ncbi:OsmC family protein [Rhizobium sp. AB2/73]|uniref:OsmC family protein n=1 Tax=Rhizobium sp. AB2/73 TaxID=2795216 RepID=UPI000DDD9983|nr:OsmC family protein [Rhizobium sp. AB2/73]QYA17445.1 OsmC family protein [Rhizobium sp. AB2/73]UEQ85766.1 OsmC family protein [Rhizobium sp. AB2/73]
MSQDDTSRTMKTRLRPIDREGLIAFAERGRANPERRGINVVRTVCEGQFRSLSYVGEHRPVIVDEPLHLMGQNTAPAPGEIVLSGLGGCIAVGIVAIAAWKNVELTRLEIHLEADIGNTAAWGAGGASREPSEMGFQVIRIKVDIEGDAPREVLDEIVQRANYYSPVANTMRNPIPFEIALLPETSESEV